MPRTFVKSTSMSGDTDRENGKGVLVARVGERAYMLPRAVAWRRFVSVNISAKERSTNQWDSRIGGCGQSNARILCGCGLQQYRCLTWVDSRICELIEGLEKGGRWKYRDEISQW